MREANRQAYEFLGPENFRTPHDTCALRANKRYVDARRSCEDFDEINIAINNTVSAKLAGCNGSSQGFEKIGHAAYSCELLRAILDSGKPAYVYRVTSNGRIVKYDIRGDMQPEHVTDLELVS